MEDPIVVGIDRGFEPDRAYIMTAQKIDGVMHIVDFFEITDIHLDAEE